MIINQSNLNIAFIGFSTAFKTAFMETTSHHASLAMKTQSGTREEHYGWLGQLPALREWVGSRVVHNLEAHDYTIKNRDFELTVEISRNDFEDDQYGIYSPFIKEMGRNAKMHPDKLLFELMVRGFTDGLCYDGQPFFDADHPVVTAAGETVSVSNVETGSAEPWFLLDTSRAVKPFVFQERTPYTFEHMDNPGDPHVFMQAQYVYGVRARVNAGFGLWQLAFGSKATLDKDSYAAARKAMMRFKGDNGEPLNVRPDTLVVGPGNEEAALGILNAERDAAGASNVWKDTAKLIVATQLD